MAEGFKERLQRLKDEEAMARLDKSLARDKLIAESKPGPLNELAMMVAGPGKFTGPVKGLLKFFPKKLDKVEAYPELQKVVTSVKGMGKGEQAAAIKILKPRIAKDKSKIEAIYNNDILNNPNASSRVATMLNKNQEAYTKLDDFLNTLVSPKKMMGGGVASLMPLKHGL